jgi:predicted CXXCH cytochrome family protein
MNKFMNLCVFSVFTLLVLSGCDPITRYKVTSTIFDGVPALPPPEKLCEDYAEKKVAEAMSSQLQKEAQKSPGSSTHLPYQEKQCDDCHDKTKEGGLIRPKNELCGVCHTNFIKGSYVHGPVATGACLACHEPHSSGFPKLLKTSPEKLCTTCHRERRSAAAMHDRFAARQLLCSDCHDPHSGNAQFFLE